MKLILTVDYEVFGNGSGSVDRCVIAPTRRILEIAESHGAPVTLFVEGLEFDAMRAAGEDGAEGPFRDWVAVRSQLRAAVRRGHDVQLHLHPQWSEARYETGAWRVDLSRWRLGDLDAVRIRELIGRGRRLLEDVVRPVRTEYRATAFRAGGWCIQPAREVLEALEAEGIRIDSSVAPGLRQADHGRWFDFRSAPRDRSHWPVRNDVTRPDAAGRVLEVPIAVGSVRPWTNLKPRLLGRARSDGHFPHGCEGGYESPGGPWGRIKGGLSRLATAHRSMLDFCRLPDGALIRISDEWRAAHSHDGPEVPLVAIGHCKNFGEDAAGNLDRFLRAAARRPDLDFGTFTLWTEAVEDARKQSS